MFCIAFLPPATLTGLSNLFCHPNQERSGEEEIQHRITEAVAVAVAAPNDLTEEVSDTSIIQLQI